MNTTEESKNAAMSVKPIALVFVALAAATAATVMTNSVQQFGSVAALSNPTAGTNLIVGAVGLVLLLPLIHVGIASTGKAYRNSRSRRNIFFGWGVALTIVQLLIFASKATTQA